MRVTTASTMMPDWVATASIGEAAVLLGFVFGLGVLVRRAWPTFSRFKDLVDDLTGEPERDGVDAKPGLMSRMKAFEVQAKKTQMQTEETHDATVANGAAALLLVQRMDGLEVRVDKVYAETNTNHGTSLRDAVNRIEAQVGEAVKRIEDHIQLSKEDRDDLRRKLDEASAVERRENRQDRRVLHAAVDSLSTETADHHDRATVRPARGDAPVEDDTVVGDHPDPPQDGA